MKDLFFKNIFRKFICWALLLQIINISIDPADISNFKGGKVTYEEDLTINEIESIYELISEMLFDKDVPECDENDDNAFKKIFHLYFDNSFAEVSLTAILPPVKYFEIYHEGFLSFFPELISPPPQA